MKERQRYGITMRVVRPNGPSYLFIPCSRTTARVAEAQRANAERLAALDEPGFDPKDLRRPVSI